MLKPWIVGVNITCGDRLMNEAVETRLFKEAWRHKHLTPLGQVEVRSFEGFLGLLNGIMATAPEAYKDIPTHEPSGLIGFPINALLDWPMASTR